MSSNFNPFSDEKVDPFGFAEAGSMPAGSMPAGSMPADGGFEAQIEQVGGGDAPGFKTAAEIDEMRCGRCAHFMAPGCEKFGIECTEMDTCDGFEPGGGQMANRETEYDPSTALAVNKEG